MKKNTVLYIALGFSICLSIVAFSLSLYFGLSDDDDNCNQPNPTTTTTTTTLPDETTTNPLVFPPKYNGTQKTAMDEFVYSQESLNQYSWFHAAQFDYNDTSAVTNASYTAHVLNLTSGEWRTGNPSLTLVEQL